MVSSSTSCSANSSFHFLTISGSFLFSYHRGLERMRAPIDTISCSEIHRGFAMPMPVWPSLKGVLNFGNGFNSSSVIFCLLAGGCVPLMKCFLTRRQTVTLWWRCFLQLCNLMFTQAKWSFKEAFSVLLNKELSLLH